MTSPGLAERLRAEIAATGPMSVAAYMTRCLHDPCGGYYATRPALGENGDFITAPMVSQMFGELIGLWAVETWSRLGRPDQFQLVELGPGDGSLIADALRAARLAPGFLAAAELTLVETSPPLIEAQRARLAAAPARWTPRLEDIAGEGPVILVANEFLDCLPARQFVRTPKGWCERVVGLDGEGALAFGLIPGPGPGDAPADAEPGLIWERSAAQTALGETLGSLTAARGGAALLIDYGRDTPGPGDTLQALSRHRKVDPLADPGGADLTVWADFPAVLAAARHAGGQTSPILTQGEFLRRLGIVERARALTRATPEGAETIARQLARLVEPEMMGSLFKAGAVHGAGLVPPGFEEAA